MPSVGKTHTLMGENVANDHFSIFLLQVSVDEEMVHLTHKSDLDKGKAVTHI